jgi:hypothetical protein
LFLLRCNLALGFQQWCGDLHGSVCLISLVATLCAFLCALPVSVLLCCGRWLNLCRCRTYGPGRVLVAEHTRAVRAARRHLWFSVPLSFLSTFHIRVYHSGACVDRWCTACLFWIDTTATRRWGARVGVSRKHPAPPSRIKPMWRLPLQQHNAFWHGSSAILMWLYWCRAGCGHCCVAEGAYLLPSANALHAHACGLDVWTIETWLGHGRSLCRRHRSGWRIWFGQ